MICQKREPRPSAGRGLGNPQMWANYVTKPPLRKLTGRAKGSARNGALTDWTPRADAGCPRSLARFRGIASTRSVLREMTVQQLAAGKDDLRPRRHVRRSRTCTRAAEDRLAALRASDGGGNEGF